MLPLFIFSSVSFTSLAVAPSDFVGRMEILLLMLLTMSAFKITVADRLPQTSRLSLLDMYILLCLLLTATLTAYVSVASVVGSEPGMPMPDAPSANELLSLKILFGLGIHVLFVPAAIGFQVVRSKFTSEGQFWARPARKVPNHDNTLQTYYLCCYVTAAQQHYAANFRRAIGAPRLSF